MILYLFDETPAKPGERHGSQGPTHCGTIRDIDYEYQVEMHALEALADYPHIVRAICPELGREWTRDGVSATDYRARPDTRQTARPRDGADIEAERIYMAMRTKELCTGDDRAVCALLAEELRNLAKAPGKLGAIR